MTITEEAHPSLSHRQVVTIIGALLLGMTMAALDQTIVATALPTIVGDIGGLDHVSWIVTAYLLAVSVSTPLYGKLGDLYGRKRLFQISIVIFLVGSVLCATATSMGTFIAYRVIQGAGAGGLIVLALAIIGDIVSPRERGRYQGIMSGALGGASIAGPLLGGFFSDNLSWRWIFLLNVPLGLAALVVTRVVLPRSPARPGARLDYLGAVLLCVAIVTGMLALAWGGNEYSWGSATIVGLFIVSFLSAVAFVMAELRAVEPLLPMHLFRLRTFALVTGIALTASVAFYSVISFLPLFLQVVNDVSATASGTLLTPLLLAFIVSSIAVGRIVSNTGHYRRYPLIGSVILTIGIVLLASLHEGSRLFQVSAYMAVCGIGTGMIMPLLVLAVQNEVPGPNMGVATSSVNFFRAIGGSLGVAITGAVFNAQLAAALTGPSLSPEEIGNLPGAAKTEYVSAFADALTTAFAVAVPIVALAIFFAFLLRDVPLRTEVHAHAEAV